MRTENAYVKSRHVRETNYFAGALCKGQSVERFFPTKRSNPELYRKFCSSCPVQELCLEFSLVFNSYGVWGGLTRSQRARLPRAVKVEAVVHGKEQGWYYIATATAFMDEVDSYVDRLIESQTPRTVIQTTVFSFPYPSFA